MSDWYEPKTQYDHMYPKRNFTDSESLQLIHTHSRVRQVFVTDASDVSRYLLCADERLPSLHENLPYPGVEGPGGLLDKVLYGEVPPRGPNPYLFIYHFWEKRYPFRRKWYPFHIPTERVLLNFSLEKTLKILG